MHKFRYGCKSKKKTQLFKTKVPSSSYNSNNHSLPLTPINKKETIPIGTVPSFAQSIFNYTATFFTSIPTVLLARSHNALC